MIIVNMNTKTPQETGDPIGQAILDYAQFKNLSISLSAQTSATTTSSL